MLIKNIALATATVATLGAVAPAMAFTSEAEAVSTFATELNVPQSVAADALAGYSVDELNGADFGRDNDILIQLKPSNKDLSIQDVRSIFQQY